MEKIDYFISFIVATVIFLFHDKKEVNKVMSRLLAL